MASKRTPRGLTSAYRKNDGHRTLTAVLEATVNADSGNSVKYYGKEMVCLERKKLLIVVDLQNDFVSGALGTPEAQAIVSEVCEKIRSWDGDLIFTMDTHEPGYLQTMEGKWLPVTHCIHNSEGWQIHQDVLDTLDHTILLSDVPFVQKNTFGSLGLASRLMRSHYDEIQLIGLCTDICVLSNAILAKASLPECDIVVDASCCAGVSPESHRRALEAMQVCHIRVINDHA